MALKRYYKGKRVIGVPVGYPETWNYDGKWKEKKIGHGRWEIDFKAIKNRPAKSYGNIGKGTTGKWKINATQKVKKIGLGRYLTRMKGFKISLGFNVKKPFRGKR